MGTGAPSPVSSGSVRRRGRRRIRLPIVPASSGDHAGAFYFLTNVFQGPPRAEFQASLEDPFYEPRDRLLIKSEQRIIAHAQLTHRQMQFGPIQIPVAKLDWLGTLHEFRRRGHGSRLLQAAEKRMAESGAVVGWLRTTIPHFFRRHGWAVCGRHHFSRADARRVLARLLDQGLRRRRRPRLQIRPWKRWEEAALMKIYQQQLEGTYGPLQRTEAYWHWLLRRQAYDQIYVALQGPDLLDLEQVTTQIVGYAVVHGERILELHTALPRRRIAVELLARVCGDTIEQNRTSVSLCAPPGDPLHRLFREAGGVCRHHEADRGEVYMTRLLQPLKLLRLLSGEFHRRVLEAELSRPRSLGLLVDGKRFCLYLNQQSVRAVSRRLGNDFLLLNVADFARMVLGQLDWSGALMQRRVMASSPEATAVGLALFPRLPLWYPPLDDLQAQASCAM